MDNSHLGLSPDTPYEQRALRYAEKYGIIEYRVIKDTMVFYTSYPSQHATYKSAVNLDTYEEENRKLKRYYKPYARIGTLQVNG